MVGRIREIVFEDGVDVDGIATLAASQAYVDAKFDPLTANAKGLYLENTSGLPTLSPWRAGVLAWDTEHDCLAVSTIYDGSWLQVGAEEQETVRNKTGSLQANGKVVYIQGATGHIPEFQLANCTDENIAKRTIGVITATAGIGNNDPGPICLSGHVHGLNTNSYTVGDILWLDTVAGGFTATRPSYQYEHIMIGLVLEKSPTDGVIYVEVRDLTDQFAKAGFHIVDPHGFTEYDDTYMTRSWVGNTFTLTQVGASTPYYCKGKLKYLTGNKSKAITPTLGAHFIGLNCATEVLEDLGGTIPAASLVSTHVLCEFCYADGTNVIYKANERHSTKFLKRDWFYKHLYLSTQYRSGIQPSITSIDGNGSSDTHAQFSTTSGIIADEDIEIAIASKAASDAKALWYYDGTKWVTANGTNGAGVLNTGSGRAAYNNIASGLVECTNNYHVLTHVFAVNDGTVICVVGNSQYLLLADARIAASTEIATLLTTGLPFPEFRAIATYINKTSDSYGNAVKTKTVSVDTGVSFIDWRKTALNPVAGQSASNHQNLSGLQGGQAAEYYHLTAAQNTNIVNNVFPSGTSTNTANKILLPTNTTAGWAALTATESLVGWDSTKKKPVVGNGTAIIPIGGGLTPVSLGIGDFTDIGGSISEYQAESGKLYLVDLTGQGATTKYKVVAPDGAAEVVYAVQCKANTNTSYLLGMKGYGGTDKFYYDGAEQTALDFAYPEMRVDFAWDSNDSHFLCGVSSNTFSTTWSGGLYLTGPLMANVSPNAVAGSDAAITLVSTEKRFIYVTLTADRIYKLPTTGIYAGDTFTFVNKSAYKLSIQSSGANAVDDITSGRIVVMALVDTPTTAANWMTVDAMSGWITFTPTGNWTTNTTYNGRYRRVGDTIEMKVSATVAGGAPGGTSTFSVNLPSGITVNTSAMLLSGRSETYGQALAFLTSAGVGYMTATAEYDSSLTTTSKTRFLILDESASSDHSLPTNLSHIAPVTIGSGDIIGVELRLPITEWSMFN